MRWLNSWFTVDSTYGVRRRATRGHSPPTLDPLRQKHHGTAFYPQKFTAPPISATRQRVC